MKTAFLFLLLLLLCTSRVLAGEIYGSLTEGDKSVGQGIKVEVISPTQTYTAETDQYGSFRVVVNEKGKCTLKVHYKQQAPALEIYSYERSVRYDLVLQAKDGQFTLKRK